MWGRLDTLKNWVIDEAKSADIYLRLEETARLYRAKNADPYRGLDLQGALEWRKTERPTDAWAKRYGAEGKETEAFAGAIAFLDESAKNWDKEQASQERLRRIAFFFACAFVVGSMIAWFYMWQWWQRAEAEQNKAVALELVAEGQFAENRDAAQLALHDLLRHRVHEALSVPARQPKLEPRLGSYAAAFDHDATSGFGFRRQLQPRR
ncbi:MAG: hypothetical protein ACREV8_08645 [Gammaproteobacteria bacterium]